MIGVGIVAAAQTVLNVNGSRFTTAYRVDPKFNAILAGSTSGGLLIISGLLLGPGRLPQRRAAYVMALAAVAAASYAIIETIIYKNGTTLGMGYFRPNLIMCKGLTGTASIVMIAGAGSVGFGAFCKWVSHRSLEAKKQVAESTLHSRTATAPIEVE
jgi:hypothetical protein